MSNKTINQALKDLFIGLGGDVSALADNTSVSDYIADLESAIKAAASGADLIDDTEASASKTYSSDKIESIIPEDELPTVTADNNGMVLTVVEGEWDKANLPASGYSETLIFEGDLSTQGDITGTLDEAITGFDAIILITQNSDPDTGDSYLTPSPYIPVSNLLGVHYRLEYGVNVNNTPISNFTFTNSTTIVWGSVSSLKKIIGVKF